MTFHDICHALQEPIVAVVIAVRSVEKFPGRQINPALVGVSNVAVLVILKDGHAWIVRCQLTGMFKAAVGRAVVHDDPLPIAESLVQYGVDTALQIRFMLIHRRYYRNLGHLLTHLCLTFVQWGPRSDTW